MRLPTFKRMTDQLVLEHLDPDVPVERKLSSNREKQLFEKAETSSLLALMHVCKGVEFWTGFLTVSGSTTEEFLSRVL